MHLPSTTLGNLLHNEALSVDPFFPSYPPALESPVAIPHNLPEDSSLPHPEKANHSSMEEDLDRDRIFSLIDRTIPFEACLYHQVIPLSLVDNQLRLGMVDLSDVAAVDYIRKVLSYLHYGLTPQIIASDFHHQILSSYLKHKAHEAAIAPPEEPTVFFERPQITVSPVSNEVFQETLNEVLNEDFDGPPTVFFERPVMEMEFGTIDDASDPPVVSTDSQPQVAQNNRHNQETLIVEAPTELMDADIQNNRTVSKPYLGPLSNPSPQRPIVPAPSLQQFDRSTIIQPIPTAITKQQEQPVSPPLPKLLAVPAIAVPGSALPLLKVNTLNYSDEQLLVLTPRELLEVLLGRILSSGIGRLFFQHEGTHGGILTSDNGVFQTVIEHLPIETFEGVITELKRLTSLPLSPTRETTQVEIERLYDKSRILLRLRLSPKPENISPQPGLKPSSKIQEEATLQILRGSALKFYQQHQASHLSRDTLSVARQLQRKVEELHRRSQANLPLNAEELAVVPELHQVVQTVNTQLTEIERQTNIGPERID